MRRGGDEPRRSLGPGPGLGFGVLLYNFGILLSSGTFLLSWEDGFSTRRLPSVFFFLSFGSERPRAILGRGPLIFLLGGSAN